MHWHFLVFQNSNTKKTNTTTVPLSNESNNDISNEKGNKTCNWCLLFKFLNVPNHIKMIDPYCRNTHPANVVFGDLLCAG